MADFHNPISKAISPDEAAETLSRYRNSQLHGKDEYAAMVSAYYDLATDFYEFGWGQSFHFAPGKNGVSFKENLANHQCFLGEALELQPGMKVLDVGCGVGGPQRALAKRFGCSIVGLNISRYQIGKCATYSKEAGLDDLCSGLHGDFMDIPAEDESFDAAYHIEALPHAPDKTAVYAEIFRVLRPGAVFAGYDWCMTPVYDEGNPEHRDLKQRIKYGNALPEIASFSGVTDGLQTVGFELAEARDRAPEADAETPWYRPLEGSTIALRSLPRTPVGRRITSAVLRVLEGVRVVPQGSREIQGILNIAADSLVAAGRLGIFTPMYFHRARKPDEPLR
jgi:sterol 24-C-methyltransferase